MMRKTERKLGLLMTIFVFVFALSAPHPIVLAGGLEGLESLEARANDWAATVERLIHDTLGLKKAKKFLKDEFGLVVRPYFKTRYEYTSNVFKTSDTSADRDDNLWTFRPGVHITHKSDLGIIGMSYEAALHYFTAQPKQNEQDQKFQAFANLKPTENTYLRLKESINQMGATAGSADQPPVNFMDNTVSVVGGYASGPLVHELGYENFDRNFQSTVAKRYSYNQNTFDYHIYAPSFIDGVKVLSGFELGLVDFSKIQTRDTIFFEIPIGFYGKLPWYDLSFRAITGFHRRNLQSGTKNDITHIVADLFVAKTFNDDKTTASLSFLRRPVESTFSTATVYDEKMWTSSVAHKFNNKFKGKFSLYAGNQDFEESVFTGTRVIVGTAVFSVPATRVKRSDNVFGLKLGFDYALRKRFILHLDYRYGRRDSNVSGLDYTENALGVSTTIPL